MKRTVDKTKLYTAEEIEAETNKGWENDEDYIDLCNFVDNAPMTQEEIEKLCAHGVTDELYGAMCP